MTDSNTDQPTNPALPSIPASLQRGGKLEEILNGTQGESFDPVSTRMLHEKFTQIVGGSLHFSRENKFNVLLLCVQAYEGDQVSRELHASAMREYLRVPDDYNTVLGDFLPEDFLRQARSALADNAYMDNTNVTAAEDWPVFRKIQDSCRQGQRGVLATGIPKLDEMIGGLRGLTVVAGDKGRGKTSLVTQIILNVLRSRSDAAVLLYSLDMPKTNIYQRLLCCESGVDYRTLVSGRRPNDVAKKLDDANSMLQSSIAPRLRIVERDFSYEKHAYDPSKPPVRRGITRQVVHTDLKRLAKSCGIHEILMVFDLFQKIDPRGDVSDGLAKDLHRLDMLQEAQLAMTGPYWPHGLPMLVISEVRKDASKGKLSYDDLTGAGRLVGDADLVLLMSPDDSEHSPSPDLVPINLRVAKGREGVRRGDVKLWFHHTCFRFFDEKPDLAGGSHFVSVNKTHSTPSGPAQAIDPLAE